MNLSLAKGANKIQFFRLEKNDHILFWLGIQHSRDINHPQFDEIETKWGEFLKEAKSPLAVVEGHPMDVVDADRNVAIERGGEVGLMEYLTKRDAVPIKCFEPYRDLEMDYVANRFGKEKTEYYYFGRAVAQWYRIVKKATPTGDLEDYLAQSLARDSRAAKWAGFDFTIEHMKQIHRKLFGGGLNLNDEDFFFMIESPGHPDNPLREVVEASGDYRDKAIMDDVKSAWDGHDIFMVYGNYHKRAHENELRKFSESKER